MNLYEKQAVSAEEKHQIDDEKQEVEGGNAAVSYTLTTEQHTQSVTNTLLSLLRECYEKLAGLCLDQRVKKALDSII